MQRRRPPTCAESSAEVVLLERLRAGDEAAFTALVARHHGAMVRLAGAFVATREAAEEVAQDTWLAVLNGLNAFEGRSALKTWIFSILTNRAKTRGQRDKRWVPLDDSGGNRVGGADAEPDRFTRSGSWAVPPEDWHGSTPEALLLEGETIDAVYQAIAGLPAGQRAVLVLRDVEALESDEICEALQVTAANQRVLLHRARARVREALEQQLSRQPRPEFRS